MNSKSKIWWTLPILLLCLQAPRAAAETWWRLEKDGARIDLVMDGPGVEHAPAVSRMIAAADEIVVVRYGTAPPSKQTVAESISSAKGYVLPAPLGRRIAAFLGGLGVLSKENAERMAAVLSLAPPAIAYAMLHPMVRPPIQDAAFDTETRRIGIGSPASDFASLPVNEQERLLTYLFEAVPQDIETRMRTAWKRGDAARVRRMALSERRFPETPGVMNVLRDRGAEAMRAALRGLSKEKRRLILFDPTLFDVDALCSVLDELGVVRAE